MLEVIAWIEFIGRVLIVALAAFSAIYTVVKAIVKKHKAGNLTVEDTEKAWLKIKEVAINAIYSVEKEYKALKAQGIKTGAFKIDSVMKTVDSYCLRNGYEYNAEEVKAFVNEQVANMKGVL